MTVILNTDYLWKLYYISIKGSRLIDYFELAGFGGDGLYTYESYGQFMDENTYQRVELNGDLSNDDFILIDSTLVNLKRQGSSFVQTSKESFEIVKEY